MSGPQISEGDIRRLADAALVPPADPRPDSGGATESGATAPGEAAVNSEPESKDAAVAPVLPSDGEAVVQTSGDSQASSSGGDPSSVGNPASGSDTLPGVDAALEGPATPANQEGKLDPDSTAQPDGVNPEEQPSRDNEDQVLQVNGSPVADGAAPSQAEQLALAAAANPDLVIQRTLKPNIEKSLRDGMISEANVTIDNERGIASVTLKFKGNNLTSDPKEGDAELAMLVSLRTVGDTDKWVEEIQKRLDQQFVEKPLLMGMFSRMAPDHESIVKAGDSIFKHQLAAFVREGLLELSAKNCEFSAEKSEKSLWATRLTQLDNVRFTDCDLDGATLKGPFNGVTFSKCELHSARFESSFEATGRFEILDSNLTNSFAERGAKLGELVLKESEIIGANLSGATARFKELLASADPADRKRAADDYLDKVSFGSRSTRLAEDDASNGELIKSLIGASGKIDAPRKEQMTADSVAFRAGRRVVDDLIYKDPISDALVQRSSDGKPAQLRFAPTEAAPEVWTDVVLSPLNENKEILPAVQYKRGSPAADGSFTEVEPIRGSTSANLAFTRFSAELHQKIDDISLSSPSSAVEVPTASDDELRQVGLR